MKTVLLYGDSNTYGTAPMRALGDARRFDGATRWAGHVARALAGRAQVIAEGHPGRTTLHDDPIEGPHRNGLTVLPAILESHSPIDVVAIMLGTNDFKARFSVTAADVALSVERLAMVVKAFPCGPGRGMPRLLLIAPPPVVEVGCLAPMFEGGAAKSQALAAYLRDAAQRQGAAFLDAGAHIAVSPTDGVHFEAEDHATLGAVITAALLPLLQE